MTAMWLAVPEDEEGMWWGDPIAADTEAEVRKLATEKWSGELPEDIDVVIYCCDHVDVLKLLKEETVEDGETAAAETRCPSTLDMFKDEGVTPARRGPAVREEAHALSREKE